MHDQDEQSRSTLAVRNVHFVVVFFPEEIMLTFPLLYHFIYSSKNLLHVIESSKQEARDSSRSAQVEARLRQNVNTLREKGTRQSRKTITCAVSCLSKKKSYDLPRPNLVELSRRRFQLRETHALRFPLLGVWNSSTSNDMNYYKRKVNELSDKLQSAHEESRQFQI